MATRKKKSRYYKNLDYRFYCRNGSLPLKVETYTDESGKEQKKCFAVLRLEASKYLKNHIPGLCYVYDNEIQFLVEKKEKYPFIFHPTQEDKEKFYKDVLSNKYNFNDLEIKQITSYLLSKDFYRLRSDTLPFSLSPRRIRDYGRDISKDSSISDEERVLLNMLAEENNPFYNERTYVEVEIPAEQCDMEDGKIKYFTIKAIGSDGYLMPYNLKVKSGRTHSNYKVTSKDIVCSLRDSIGEYLKGNVKAKNGDYYHDYIRIIPIGTNREMYYTGDDGVGRFDVEKEAMLEYEKERIEDPILRNNLGFSWEGIVIDCKEWLSKKSKADLAKKLGNFNKIYMASLSRHRLYPSALVNLSRPNMINRQYDKLNYNLFMLDSGFEYFGKGQIEIDEDGDLNFVHYEKESTEYLYIDETSRDLRKIETFGRLVSREKSVPIIKEVDEYQRRSVNNLHMKPYEYGYKDRTKFLDLGFEDYRHVIFERLNDLKSVLKENECYLIPPFKRELEILLDKNASNTITTSEKNKMYELLNDYYDDLLEEREREHYWYVDLSKITEDMDLNHVDFATCSLFNTLLAPVDFYRKDETIFAEEDEDVHKYSIRKDPIYRVASEQTIKKLKDIVYFRHMAVAEGKHQLKSEKNKSIIKKNKKS